MALVIDIDKVYKDEELTATSQRDDDADTDADAAEIRCLVKVEFRKTFQSVKRENRLVSTKSEIIFGLGSPLDENDRIKFQVFSLSRTRKLLFKQKLVGTYEMLLESLIALSQKKRRRKNKPVHLVIDDFLSDPKSNRIINIKLKFKIEYFSPTFDKEKHGDRTDGTTAAAASAGADNNDLLSNITAASSSAISGESGREANDQQEIDYENIDWEYELSDDDFDMKHEIKSGKFLRNAIGRATLSLAQTAFNPNMILDQRAAAINAIRMNSSNNKRGRRGFKNFIFHKRNTMVANLIDTGRDSNETADATAAAVENKDSNTTPGSEHKNPKILFNQLLILNNEITSWQIRVKIIEIKYLLGSKLNDSIYFTVDMANQVFRSNAKTLDSLTFDEVFSIRIDNIKSQTVLNYVITIMVYQKNFLVPDMLIGSFQIDFGTIYKHSNHEILHKWAPLTKDDFNDNIDGYVNPKGFLKCDLSVIPVIGDKIETRKEENDYDDDIDSNMIIPFGLETTRAPIEIIFMVYSADILVKFTQSKFSTLKARFFSFNNYKNVSQSKSNSNLNQLITATASNNNNYNSSNISNKDTVMINLLNDDERVETAAPDQVDLSHFNTFIRITYQGVTKRTQTIRATNKPNWEERLTFKCLFPPLIRQFKIELCNEDTFGMSVMATDYLNTDDISDYSSEDTFLPTLGPCNIDLYTEPHSFRVNKNTNLKSSGINNSIDNVNEQSVINEVDERKNDDEEEEIFKSSSKTTTTQRIYIPIFGDTHSGAGDYVARLFLCVKSIKIAQNALNYKYDEELRQLDQKRKKVLGDLKDFLLFSIVNEASLIDERYSSSQLSFRLTIGTFGYDQTSSTFTDQSTNLTKPIAAFRLGPKMPLYLPFEKSKSCMSLSFHLEDLRHLMYKSNFIKYSFRSLLNSDPKSYDRLTKYQLDEYLKETVRIRKYLENDFIKAARKNKIQTTDLEKNRVKQLLKELNVLIEIIKSYKKYDDDFKRMSYMQMKDSVQKISCYLAEPLSFVPDVSIWMLADDKPVGVCTVKASDIVWSTSERKRGFICNQSIYTDIKSLNQADKEHPIRENLARVRINLWLGLYEEKASIFQNLNNNDGHGLSENHMNRLGLPSQIFYSERLSFELRAYIYQGREMLGLDSTGLSDPFIQLTIGNQSVYSKVIQQTNNPIWAVTLRISQIYYYGRFESFCLNPPEVNLLVFDEDMVGENELIGKCYIKPIIKSIKELHDPPPLKWRKIYLKDEPSGDILASFELVLTSMADYSNVRNQKVNRIDSLNLHKYLNNNDKIPASILPKMCSYSLEILYWGLRNIRQLNSVIFGQDKLMVRIEIGENVYQSSPIDKQFVNENFQFIHQKHTIILPESDEYKPHLNIRCLSYSLSRQNLVGSYTVKSISDFYKSLNQLKEQYKSYLTLNYKQTLSLSAYQTDNAADIQNDLLFNANNNSGSGSRLPMNRESFIRKKRIHERIEQKKKKAKQRQLANSSFSAENAKKNNGNNNTLLDIEYLDWWSKYYASTQGNDVFNKIKKKNASLKKSVAAGLGSEHATTALMAEVSSSNSSSSNEDLETDSSSSSSATSVHESYPLKATSKTNDDENGADDDDDDDVFDESRSNKKNARFSSKRRRRVANKKKTVILVKPKRKKLQDTSNNMNHKKRCKAKSKRFKNVQKIQVYDCELEQVDQFRAINETMSTFPLLRGKNQQANLNLTPSDMIQCHFKGNFLLYKEDEELAENFKILLKRYGGFLKTIPLNTSFQVKCRVYVIKALILNKSNNDCQPYLYLQYGDTIIDNKENIKYNTLEPVFGSLFEFDVRFPYESILTVGLNDWNLLRTNNKNQIGRTKIDLEDRFYSKQYATCGIPKRYELNGYNAWRDVNTPSQILSKLCKEWRLDRPEFFLSKESNNYVKMVSQYGETKEYHMHKKSKHLLSSSSNETAAAANQVQQHHLLPNSAGLASSSSKKGYKDLKTIKEQLALAVLNDWENIAGVPLVPEHVETRSLYHSDRPNIEQAKLQMWIDIFPFNESSSSTPQQHLSMIKPPVDVAPRKPKKFQLRVIIYNTVDVPLDDVNILSGEKSSDIYVRGFFAHRPEEAQKTDTHFRSLNGEGNFNWRFIFDFDYLPAEEKIVYSKREHALSLHATEFKAEPIIDLQCWDADVVTTDDQLGSLQMNLCCMQRGSRTSKACKLEMLTNQNWPKINLFKHRNHRGWWPMFTYEQNRMKLAGKVEAEFILLNEQQALEKPAGLGRSEPDPLPEPNRPDTSFLWFMAPFRTFQYIIWKNNKCFIIKIVLVALLIIFLIVLIYTLPSTLITKAITQIG